MFMNKKKLCDIGGKEKKEGGREEVREEENQKGKLVRLRAVPESPQRANLLQEEILWKLWFLPAEPQLGEDCLYESLKIEH